MTTVLIAIAALLGLAALFGAVLGYASCSSIMLVINKLRKKG